MVMYYTMTYFMNLKLIFFSLFALTFVFVGCGDDDKDKYIPDVSNIVVDVPIKRFEQDLFNIDSTNMEASLSELEKKHPVFAELFFAQILGSKDPKIAPQGHETYIKNFVNFPTLRPLYDTTQIVLGDLASTQKEFNQAFQFFKYYFPNQKLPPHITTFISEYTLAGFIYDNNALAVGLDFFLGADYSYQYHNPANPNFSNYLTRAFNKDHLVMKTLMPLIEDASILGNPSGNRLLDMMVHNGKKHYVLSQILPYAPDSIIMEYSQKQMDWVEKNEFQMWTHLATEDLFYSTDNRKIRKLVQYSPHSSGMPPEAPGRTANWLGWQIVKAYMKRLPETTLEELMKIKNPQEILDQSKYKPRR